MSIGTDAQIRDLIEKVGIPLIHRFMIQRYQLKVCGFVSQEFVNALAKRGIEARVVDTGRHATARVTLPSGIWDVDLTYAQFLCDIDEDSEVEAMISRIEADPWETIRYSGPFSPRVANSDLSGYTGGMSKFNEPYAATEASLLRANTSQKGYRYDYDPGIHHARFSNANMKAWGTTVYEDSFQYYNEGKCFIFISSDKAGSGRKFTVFSTCDGGYSLTKVDQVNTKAQATHVVREALDQVGRSPASLNGASVIDSAVKTLRQVSSYPQPESYPYASVGGMKLAFEQRRDGYYTVWVMDGWPGYEKAEALARNGGWVKLIAQALDVPTSAVRLGFDRDQFDVRQYS